MFHVSGEPMFDRACRFILYRGIGVETTARRQVARGAMTMSSIHHPNQDRLLAALPPADFIRLSDHLELVAMRLGDFLYEPSEQLQHACFPTTSIVSLHYVTESGASAEIAGVGNEGVVGISLFMGGDTTPSSAVVQTAGHAYRLPRHLLKSEFERAGPIHLLRYTQALITQMTQTAVCNRYHSLDQQLCRWLLMTLDRIFAGELVMTQELVANMLGVRREGVTMAAGKLQEAGLTSGIGAATSGSWSDRASKRAYASATPW